jgi:hypothetical protein
MCTKQKKCNREIDDCLQVQVKIINFFPQFTTLLSCCGHSKYKPTIVTKNNITNEVYEWYSGITLSSKTKNNKTRKRFYQKDKEGIYFLPEILCC